MPQPRATRGTPLSAAAFNSHSDAIDRLGYFCTVRVSGPGVLNPNTDYTVTFAQADVGSNNQMWNSSAPSYIVAPVDGQYLAIGQSRWAPVSTGSPYSTGQRAGKILVNSTDPNSTDNVAGPKTSAKLPAAVDGEGVTLTMIARLTLYAGDRVYLNAWHSAAAALTALQTNFGGTFLSLNYQAALS